MQKFIVISIQPGNFLIISMIKSCLLGIRCVSWLGTLVWAGERSRATIKSSGKKCEKLSNYVPHYSPTEFHVTAMHAEMG